MVLPCFQYQDIICEGVQVRGNRSVQEGLEELNPRLDAAACGKEGAECDVVSSVEDLSDQVEHLVGCLSLHIDVGIDQVTQMSECLLDHNQKWLAVFLHFEFVLPDHAVQSL